MKPPACQTQHARPAALAASGELKQFAYNIRTSLQLVHETSQNFLLYSSSGPDGNKTHQVWTHTHQQLISPPCYENSSLGLMLKLVLRCRSSLKQVGVKYHRKWAHGVLSDDTGHTRDFPSGVSEKERSSCSETHTGAWGGFSERTGTRTTVRSSIWRPSAPAWLTTKVRHRGRLRLPQQEVVSLCLSSGTNN